MGCDQLQLFESALRDPNRFGETLARLKALVGNDHIGIPVPTDTHKPDSFALRDFFVAAVYDRRSKKCDDPAAAGPPLQLRGLPLRRCRPPCFAQVTLTNGLPAELHSDLASGEITHRDGPFRLSGNWWDDKRWELEEWDVELADGSLYRLARSGSHWTVEGCYEGG